LEEKYYQNTYIGKNMATQGFPPRGKDCVIFQSDYRLKHKVILSYDQ